MDIGRRAPADRRHEGLSRASFRRGAIRSPALMQTIFDRVRSEPKRVVFAEGEEEQVIRAALAFVNEGLGTRDPRRPRGPRRRDRRRRRPRARRQASKSTMRSCPRATPIMRRCSMQRLQRKGYLFRDCQRLINNDRNHFAAAMVAKGDADAMVTGVTRNFSSALEDVRRVVDPKPGQTSDRRFARARQRPRRRRRRHGDHRNAGGRRSRRDRHRGGAASPSASACEPRVAMLAFSTFGHPPGERTARVHEAVSILDQRKRRFRL